MAENDENNPVPEGRGQPEHGRKGSSGDSGIEEYRLVPIGDAYPYDGDEKIIDFVGLSRDLWDHRPMLLKVLALFIVLGSVLYFFGERMFYTETSLMPENRSSSQVDRLMQQYQGILGIQAPMAEGEELSVTLYPEIVKSLPFQMELIQREIHFADLDRELTLFEYLNDVREPTKLQKAGNFVWGMTFGLPGTLRGFFSSSGGGGQQEGIDFSRYSDFDVPQVIEPDVLRAVRTMQEWTTVRIEPQTNFIVIGVSLPDAQASAEAVNIVKELLQRFVTEYRIDKARQDMQFIEGQYEQAKVRFEQVQDSMAVFRDQNVLLSSARSQVTEQRLQSQYSLAYDIYNTLATRLEEARIKVQEETPVFRVHEPVTVPTSPATPNFTYIFAGAVFLGLFFGIALIYIRRGMLRFHSEFKNRPSAFG
ncbi:MAG: hypothetical protein WD317_09285 [Balneolaceae bacterium]